MIHSSWWVAVTTSALLLIVVADVSSAFVAHTQQSPFSTTFAFRVVSRLHATRSPHQGLDSDSIASEDSVSSPGFESSSSRRDFLRRVPVTVSATAASVLLTNTNPSQAKEIIASSTTLNTHITAATSSLSLAASIGTTRPIQLPPMGLGAWSWGDSLFWGYNSKNDDELQQVFEYAVSHAKNNVTLIDTAEVYGNGRSETLIGEFARSYPPETIQIATKFAPLPFRSKPQDVVKACEASLKRLGRSSIDLYQIHFPGLWNNAEYWDGLALAYEQGLVKAVGVSNYGVDAIRACHAALSKRGIPLATNQIQFSLLYRYPIENGLLRACDDLGIQVLSYSPLALGMLTGKYTPQSPPSGPRKAVYDKLISTPDYDNLLDMMKDIAALRPNGSVSQVALNWARAKKTVPIPGARTLSQIQQNYNALTWDLSPEEVRALDVAASKVSTFIKPEQGFFPKEDLNTHLRMFDS